MTAVMPMSSAAFADHDTMPERLSRPGGNVSPPIEWSDVPSGTEELVLMCEDPDAGREPFLHWLVTGIDPDTRGFDEGQLPPGGHIWPNDFGQPGYDGPQPPVGDGPHRYYFRLYAVSQPPRLPERPRASDVHRAVERHELGCGTLVGRFSR